MQNKAVEIEFRLHRLGRSKEALERSPSDRGRLPRVSQVMALAIQFQETIQTGEARDYADLARLGCLTRERMSQIMELLWLAPEIQQEILEFPPSAETGFPISEVAVRRIGELLDWAQQRSAWRLLKNRSHL